MSQVSVIMVSYHTGQVLPIAVTSVLQQQGLAELILVDNGNPPDVLARLQQMALMDARLRIISGHGNIGFAGGCNVGAKIASGEYLLFLNPDCIVPPGALTRLVHEMNVLPNTALAGVHLVNADGTEQRGSRRHLLTPGSALMHVFGLGRKLPPAVEETHDVPAISGACMCIRKVDFELLGGFDEGYFLHVEDLDFCIRVARSGKRIVYVPSVTIAHMLSTSGEVASDTIERYKAHGFIRYFSKHFAGALPPGAMPLLKASIWLRYYLRKTFGSGHTTARNASRKLMILASSLTAPAQHNGLSGKTVFVTGATSQIGLFVVQQLLSSGAAVLAVSRDQPLPFAHPHLKWLTMDITRDDFSLGGYLADVAIHCAPLWYLPKILPTLAASDVKRVVGIGSTSVFSKSTSANHYEKDLVAKLKLAEQQTASVSATNNIAWTILRPTMIYGAGLDKNVSSLARFIARFGCFAIYPPAMGRRQPVHAEDVATAALLAASNDASIGMAYNISGADILTYRAMLEAIFTTLKRPVKIIETTLLPSFFALAGIILRKSHITREMAYRMNEDLVFFHDDATRDFAYAPRNFLSGGMADIEGTIWRE